MPIYYVSSAIKIQDCKLYSISAPKNIYAYVWLMLVFFFTVILMHILFKSVKFVIGWWFKFKYMFFLFFFYPDKHITQQSVECIKCISNGKQNFDCLLAQKHSAK